MATPRTQPLNLADKDERALARVFAGYVLSATVWLLFATFVGILLAYKFGAPDFGSGAWLTFGRLRPIHTNGTFYGWASMALVGLAYYIAARSCRTSLYSPRLAWIGLALFNLAAIAGTIALDLGYNDGDLEYREWPWPIRLVFLAALVVAFCERIDSMEPATPRWMPSVQTIRSILAMQRRARRSRSGCG